jgi:uncharacterized membrane protein YidH (DUF202 family)
VTSPADKGMQAERTALAWRRTALSVAVGSLIGLRVLPPQLGAIGYAVAALGLVWSLDLALTARRRYRDGSRLVHAGAVVPARGVPAPTLARTAATTAIVGLAALVFVLVIASR